LAISFNLKIENMKIFSHAKKLILLFISIVLINTLIIQAQNESGFGIDLKVGVRTGFALPVLTIDHQPYTNHLAAPVAGGYVQLNVMSWVAASFDVLYTQYGGNQINPLWIYSPESPALDNLQNSKLVIHSLEFPLAVKVGLPNWAESVSPYISLGGSMAFFMQARIRNYYLDGTYSYQPIYSESTELVSSAINNFDFAFIPAIGVEFNSSPLSFTLEFYYRLGLSDVNNYKTLYSTDFGANAFGIKIGVGLGL
jgi:hypothetical protein